MICEGTTIRKGETQGLEGEVVAGNAGKDPKEALSVHTFLSR